MSTRSITFVTGIETSTAPTQSDPSADGDFVFKSYADKTYSMRSDWGADVADYTALKAISESGTNSRVDGQVRAVQGTQELWIFEASSSATEDGVTILQPTSGTGRWLKLSGGSAAASGSTSNLEFAQLVNKLKGLGLRMPEVDNSALITGFDVPFEQSIVGYLIQNYTASDASAYIVWNPKVLNDSDKNYDATTNWTATGAAASLATSATAPKVGANKLTFDKNNTATQAAIRYDRASQNLSLAANYRVWFWVELPSVTDLSNVFLRVYADTTSNYRTWTVTTNYAGSALATGYNLITVDISTGGTASGTGWVYSQLSRYVEVGVTTGSASQTYTGIAFGGLWFSHGPIDDWNPKGLEFTIVDTSTKDDIVIDEASAFMDGVLTLNASIAEGYTAGISNSDAATVRRSSAEYLGAGFMGFDEDLSSGEISLEQEFRISEVLRESITGNLAAYIDHATPMIFKVTAVGGSTIDVYDPDDLSAELLNNGEIYIFTNNQQLGKNNFTLLAQRTMTSDATHSSGTTTITVSPTSVSVGDFVVKKELNAYQSLVAISSSENFSAMTLATAPNGIQLMSNGLYYPNATNLYAHWYLGAATEDEAKRDRANVAGSARNLTKIGTPNLQGEFLNGKYSLKDCTASHYLRTAGGDAQQYDGNGETIYYSLWFYTPGGAPATSQNLLVVCSASGGSAINGWFLYGNSIGGTLTYITYSSNVNTGTITSVAPSAGWHHCLLKVNNGASQMWMDGVSVNTTAGGIGTVTAAQALYIGVQSAATTLDSVTSNPANIWRIADVIVWQGGTMGTSEAQYLYNAGYPEYFDNAPIVRSKYSVTAVSGQRVSMKAKLSRTTTAVKPYIRDMGILKV